MFKLMQHIEDRRRVFKRFASRSRDQHVALVLAGGDGMRLQALTREITGAPIPKQYCPLLNGKSLLESTLSRIRGFASPLRTMVIVNRDHLELARPQLHSLPGDNIFIQPCNRDTGPGMIFALLQLARIYPDAVVAVFPSDHYVDNDREFIRQVRRGALLASRFPDKIAILGIAPNRPEQEYGYILPSDRVGSGTSGSKAFHVAAFHEKPSLETAQNLVREGGLWNTFVMVFRVSRMLDLLKRIAPAGSEVLFDLEPDMASAADLYERLLPWNFSTQFLTLIPEHLIVLRVDKVTWSDWGTRTSIERTYKRLQLVPAWQQNGRLPVLETTG